MDKSSQVLQSSSISISQSVLTLSGIIANKPGLYPELAENPYSSKSLQAGLVQFPGLDPLDIILATILAEPEGKYDRDFVQLPQELQKVLLEREVDQTGEVINRLSNYCSHQQKVLRNSSQEQQYLILFQTAFQTNISTEFSKNFSRNQRKEIKLLIFNFISKHEAPKPVDHIPKLQLEITTSNREISKIFQSKWLKPVLILGVPSLIFIILLVNGYFDKLILLELSQNPFSHKIRGQVLAVDTQEINRSLPVSLKIPSINVDTSIENMGVTDEGAMDVPQNTINVGWYKFGPSPGEKGNAVISGHFDGRSGKSGVFNNLDKLKSGDKIYVTNNLGADIIFTIRESRTYNPGFADEVFYSNDGGIHLNLVTCDGVWDGAKKSYTKRLVVFADSL